MLFALVHLQQNMEFGVSMNKIVVESDVQQAADILHKKALTLVNYG